MRGRVLQRDERPEDHQLQGVPLSPPASPQPLPHASSPSSACPPPALDQSVTDPVAPDPLGCIPPAPALDADAEETEHDPLSQEISLCVSSSLRLRRMQRHSRVREPPGKRRKLLSVPGGSPSDVVDRRRPGQELLPDAKEKGEAPLELPEVAPPPASAFEEIWLIEEPPAIVLCCGQTSRREGPRGLLTAGTSPPGSRDVREGSPVPVPLRVQRMERQSPGLPMAPSAPAEVEIVPGSPPMPPPQVWDRI